MLCGNHRSGSDSSRNDSSRSPADAVMVIGIFNATLALPSLILNLHLILAVLFSRSSRTVENILKGNISFANLVMVCSAQVPFAVTMLGLVDSQLWYRVLGSTMITVSLAALCILTVDKYIAIYYPFFHYKTKQPRTLLVLILFSWSLTFGTGVLTTTCFTRATAFLILTVLKIGMASFMVFAHLRILATLFKIHNEVASLEHRFSQSSEDRIPRSIKGIRCTAICLMLALLCHAPYSVLSFRVIFHDLQFQRMHFYLTTLVYLPAAVIPILIIWTTKSFRVAIFSFYNRFWSASVEFINLFFGK